jgi:hypothetical protein
VKEEWLEISRCDVYYTAGEEKIQVKRAVDKEPYAAVDINASVLLSYNTVRSKRVLHNKSPT